MSNNIELRHLRYFLTVADELHFSKSAEKLFITQPALSRQIKQLEDYLGTPLLIRDKRNVKLTRTGEYLKDEAQFIFNHLDFVRQNIRHLSSGDKGQLRIGFVGSAMQSIIPGLLRQIHDQSPDIHTVLTELPNQDQIDRIKKDELDIGFIRTMRLPEGLYKKDVYEESFCLVLPSNHPLDQKNFKTVKDLENESFILFSSQYSHGYYEKIMSIFEDYGFTPKVAHESVHSSTIFRLVENELGIGIVPSSLKRGFNLDIKFIDLNKIPQRTTLSAVWKTDNRNPVLDRITALLN